jgi:hypothetical protein
MNAAVLGWADRRRFARVPVAGGGPEVTLGPRGLRGSAAQVLDFSPGGVLLQTEETPTWLAEDAPLSLRVGEHDISCSLAPESFDPSRWLQARPERVGLALTFARAEQDQVTRLYHRLRFPALHRRGAVPGAEVRALLAESGYMALRPGLEPADAWLRADWPGTLSHEAVFRDPGGPAIGHLAVTRAYANSWIGHEIAMLPRSSDNLRCRRDLYQHFCVWPRLLDGEGTYVFGYYSPKRRFHQEMFEAFASRSAADECVVVRMERYMRDKASAPEGLDLDGLVLEPMQRGDEPEVLALIEQSWPALARAALDIAPGSLTQDSVHPGFAALGGQRARQCLVLRSGERLIAALLCEWESAGVSLFDALSVAHVFLARGVETSSRLEKAITSVLYAFYTTREVNIPMFTCPPGTFHRRDVPGFKWVETMGCIVFSSRALRAFESYVELSLDLDS